MKEQRQSQLAGKVTKKLPRSGFAQGSVSQQDRGLFHLERSRSASRDPYDLSEDSQDGQGEREIRRPAKKARINYADRVDHSFVQNCEENVSVATNYPTPRLTKEPPNASTTINLWPFSTTDDLDAANPGSLAATFTNLDQFIHDTYLQECHPATPGVPLQRDGNEVLASARHAMNLSSLSDSSRTWGRIENGIGQEDDHTRHIGRPDNQETRGLSYADEDTHDAQETAVEFMQFVNIPELTAEEDNYSMGSIDEDDLAELADSVDQRSRQTPPTSVLREISSISSVGTFDPGLKRSSPGTSLQELEEEELLDSDIDWSPVLDQLASQPKPHPLDQSASQEAPDIFANNSHHLELARSRHPAVQPFTRAPFPSILRDKSPICGFSNSTVSRTCFRLGHLIAQNAHNSSLHQDVVYEIYARVSYSYRNRPSSTQVPLFNLVKHDNSTRAQHFQFMDLWKDFKPHVWGVLENWRPDGVLDKQSSAFLSAGPPASQFSQQTDAERERKLCRCICRISKAPKGESQAGGRSKINNPEIGGWAVKVLWIEEVGWDTIEKLKGVFCQE